MEALSSKLGGADPDAPVISASKSWQGEALAPGVGLVQALRSALVWGVGLKQALRFIEGFEWALRSSTHTTYRLWVARSIQPWSLLWGWCWRTLYPNAYIVASPRICIPLLLGCFLQPLSSLWIYSCSKSVKHQNDAKKKETKQRSIEVGQAIRVHLEGRPNLSRHCITFDLREGPLVLGYWSRIGSELLPLVVIQARFLENGLLRFIPSSNPQFFSDVLDK